MEIAKSRIAFIYFCIMAAFIAIILRMIFIVVTGDKVEISGIYDPKKSGRRANIVDTQGVLVATDLKTKSLYVSTVLVKNPKRIAKKLAQVFDNLSYDEVYKKLVKKRKSRHWILIRRNLTPLQVKVVQDLQMAGLLFEDDRRRVYPQKSITSHFVGYVDLDRKGLSGVERQFNRGLTSGNELQISMDVRAQDILYDELESGIKEFKAKAAFGIIMDVNSGEVLALSSLPSFDPNAQYKAKSHQKFNRVTNGVYELGSVFKIFTNAIAFDNNLVKKSDKFNVKDPIKYGKYTITDDHPEEDIMSVEDLFAYSSNIGTVKIAQKIGIEKQKEFFGKIGLLKKIDSDFPGLGRPIYPKKWREINLYTISYGHGIAVTPLHLALSVSSMVNGGILHQPSFTKLEKQPEGKKIIKESTSKLIRTLMRKTVTKGTGKKANIEGYEVGGKTGTAEYAEKGSYNERKTIASFVGVFPMSKPKYLVYVAFDQPNYTFNTGGMVAAPVVGRVIKNIAPLLGVLPRN